MHVCHTIGDIVNDSDLQGLLQGHPSLRTAPISVCVLPKWALLTVGRENYNSKIIRSFPGND